MLEHEINLIDNKTKRQLDYIHKNININQHNMLLLISIKVAIFELPFKLLLLPYMNLMCLNSTILDPDFTSVRLESDRKNKQPL